MAHNGTGGGVVVSTVVAEPILFEFLIGSYVMSVTTGVPTGLTVPSGLATVPVKS